MPNWCENDLFVRGDPARVQQFVRYAAAADGTSAFDFNRFVQMPESLEVSSGSDEMYYDAWYGDDASLAEILTYPWVLEAGVGDREGLKALLTRRNQDAEKLAQHYRANVEQYGCKTWYDWAVQHWGTKWNAGEVKPPELRKEGRLAL